MVVVIAAVGAGLVGLAAWTLTEYGMHRFAMHGHDRNPLGAEHRRHHRDPLETSLPLRSLGHGAIWAVAALVAWPLGLAVGAGVAVGFATGWAGGYSTYELLHWRSHHREPRTRYTRWLRARHEAHHSGGPRTNLGVTTAVWDRVFSTGA